MKKESSAEILLFWAYFVLSKFQELQTAVKTMKLACMICTKNISYLENATCSIITCLQDYTKEFEYIVDCGWK